MKIRVVRSHLKTTQAMIADNGDYYVIIHEQKKDFGHIISNLGKRLGGRATLYSYSPNFRRWPGYMSEFPTWVPTTHRMVGFIRRGKKELIKRIPHEVGVHELPVFIADGWKVVMRAVH